MLELRQQRLEGFAPPAVAAGSERAQGIAVIALPAADDVAALGLSDLQKVLPRHLERSLDSFRAARVEVHTFDAGRRVIDDGIGERLGDLGGKKRRMRVSELVELALDRRGDTRMTVAKARHGRTAGRIEVT